MKWHGPKRIAYKEYPARGGFGSDLGALVPPETWLRTHYFEAYNILFRVENSLRTFVYLVLKMQFGEKWQKISVLGEGPEKESVASRTKRLAAQTRKYAYLGHELACHLLLLSLGELVEIMTADMCWRHFKRFFSNNKEATLVKFYEIIAIRNALAHFRPINEQDLTTLKTNSEHLLSSVANFLNGTLNTVEPVPQMESPAWMESLQTLESSACSTRWKRSPDTGWLAFSIAWTFPVAKLPDKPGDRDYSVLCLDTPEILRATPRLRERVSFSYELCLDYLRFDMEEMPMFGKETLVVFHRHVLEQNADDVREDLQDVLDAISSDTALLVAEPLRKGRFVKIAHITSDPKTVDSSEYQGLCCKKLDASLPEYWGVFALAPAVKEFITGTYRFPWFTEIVANAEWLP